VLTVDDEPLALRRLALALSEMPDIEHAGEASGCEEAIREIARLRPNILLLDIRMRDGTGFDVIDQLPTQNSPAVIFVSAFDHYAARAFEASVVDYVLKPVEFDRLRDALDRARVKLEASDAGQQLSELRTVIASLRASMRERNPPQFEPELWIRKNSQVFPE
jgi:two-component system LytT family response regulator